MSFPIYKRTEHLGGIESISIDGHRVFFGFDYGEDVVLSGPINDENEIAEFASEHIMQRDGKHDQAYWVKLVDQSIVESNLAKNTDFVSEHMMKNLRMIIENGKPIKSFDFEHHILYLLSSILGDEAYDLKFNSEQELVFNNLDLCPQDWFVNVKFFTELLNGNSDIKEVSLSEVAQLFLTTMQEVIRQLPECWKDYFGIYGFDEKK